MTDIPSTQATDPVPTYLRSGDPTGKSANHYPAWVDKLASDVTLEGRCATEAVQGADAVRALVGGARQLYDRQDFNFAGACGENGFIEDYTTEVRGRPLGAVHLITFDAGGRSTTGAEFADVLLPPAARKVHRHAIRRALPRWRR